MFATSLVVLSLLAPAMPGAPEDIKTPARADFIVIKPVGDLSGYYICEGQEGPDKRYKGIAIVNKLGDAYTIHWIIGSSINYTGIAIRNDTTLSAGWALPVGEKGSLVRGVTMFRIEPGPRLIGRWSALPGDGTMRTETLTFLKKIED